MIKKYNDALLLAITHNPEVLWVDKGIFVYPRTLEIAKSHGIKLVHYSPDNYFLYQNSSRYIWDGLSKYDLVVTTKSNMLDRLKNVGASSVLLSGNAFDPQTHYPVELDDQSLTRFSCEVSFIGRWEPEREMWLEQLSKEGIHLSVRGPQWERARSRALIPYIHLGSVLGLDYTKAIRAAKINLCFLSRLAQDSVTQRSVEIPACSAFMLAERTEEHLKLFTEDYEAVYFNGYKEMFNKIKYYLQHDDERRQIAELGLARCIESGYSYENRINHIMLALH